MGTLMVDFITSLDGYAAAEGWPGFWGMEGPEYLGWLGEAPEREHATLMGANTYRLMSGFSESVDDDRLRRPGPDVEGGLLLDLGSPAVVGQLDAGHRGPGGRRPSDEAGWQQPAAHPRQHHLVSDPAVGWARGSLPCGRLPGDHRDHGQDSGSTTTIRTSPSRW